MKQITMVAAVSKILGSGDVLPWERQPTENARQYEAFEFYRDMPLPRSCEKIWPKTTYTNKHTMYEIHKRNNWGARVRAYDAWVDEAKRKNKEREIEKLSRQGARIAFAILDKAEEKLMKVSAEDLPVGMIAYLYEVAMRQARLSMGVPTDISQRDVKVGGAGGDAIRVEGFNYMAAIKDIAPPTPAQVIEGEVRLLEGPQE